MAKKSDKTIDLFEAKKNYWMWQQEQVILQLPVINCLKPEKITGIDISEGMLEIGRKKIEKLGLQDKIELLNGDSEAIFYKDNSFDAVTVAFGVRNFENLEKGLSEIYRVLKPGGKLVVLSVQGHLYRIKNLYNFYMKL